MPKVRIKIKIIFNKSQRSGSKLVIVSVKDNMTAITVTLPNIIPCQPSFNQIKTL